MFPIHTPSGVISFALSLVAATGKSAQELSRTYGIDHDVMTAAVASLINQQLDSLLCTVAWRDVPKPAPTPPSSSTGTDSISAPTATTSLSSGGDDQPKQQALCRVCPLPGSALQWPRVRDIIDGVIKSFTQKISWCRCGH